MLDVESERGMMLDLPPEKRLLLQAAFASPEAERAWQQWLERIDIDDIDAESQRALPNLHINSALAASADSRVQGLYRRTWYSNTLLLEQVKPLLARLAEGRVRVLAAKQSAAVVKVRGCYPLDQFHLLVADTDFEKTVVALSAGGWHSERPARHIEAAFGRAQFVQGAFSIQLSCESARNDGFWNRVERVDSDAGVFEVPGHADRMLEAAAPKHAWYRTSMFQRLLGTLIVIHYGEREPDWSTLAGIGARCDATLPLADTLAQLEHDFGIGIPNGYLAELRDALVTPQHAAEYRLRYESKSWWRKIRLFNLDYRRLRELSAAQEESLSLLDYLKFRWSVNDVRGMLRHTAAAMTRANRNLS